MSYNNKNNNVSNYKNYLIKYSKISYLKIYLFIIKNVIKFK